MTTFKRLSITAVALAALLGSGCSKQINFLKARNELNKGVGAFKAAEYNEAAARFQAALDLDPELNDARAYQAYSYMMQYIPGGESAENQAMAEKALAGFDEVLAKDPKNTFAVSAVASLYFNMKNFDEAETWHRKRIGLLEEQATASETGEIDPVAAESYYTIGVIKWTESYQPRLQVRADLGMKPDDPGPIKDEEKRTELAETAVPVIDEGLTALTKALEINPDYADAMAYLNLLNRERADLAETDEEYEQYLAKADEWVERTLETTKRLNDESTIDQFAAE